MARCRACYRHQAIALSAGRKRSPPRENAARVYSDFDEIARRLSEIRQALKPQSSHFVIFVMLAALNIIQLVLYIALLALLAQGALYVMAGARRTSNFMYQLFQSLNKPWFKGVRFLAPKQVADQQVPIVAFFIIAVLYAAVTLAKIEHCVSVAMQGCK